jgi:hypothetical protein
VRTPEFGKSDRKMAMSKSYPHSGAGILSFGLGLAMVLVEVFVFIAAKLQVKFYGNLQYVLGFPLNVMLFTFVPCIGLAMIGLVQPRRKRAFAFMGLALALASILGLGILGRSFKVGAGIYMGLERL